MSAPQYKIAITAEVEVRTLREMEVTLQKQIVQAQTVGRAYEEQAKQLTEVRARLKELQSVSQATTPKAVDETERYARALEQMDRAAHEAKATEAQRLIDLQNTTKQTGKGADETDNAAGKFRLFARDGGEVKKVLNQITAQVPLLGGALQALLSPIGAAMTVAGVLFRAVQKDIAETNARLDDMAARAATPLANFAANFKKAQDEARAANREFSTGLDQLAEQSNAIKAGADAALASIQRYASAQLELNNAAQAKVLAEINLAETRGQMTAPQAIDARRQVNEFYAQQARETQTAAEEKVLQNRAAELARKESELGRVAGLAGPGAADTDRNARLRTLREQEANANKAADELREKDLKAAQAAQAKADAKVQSRRDLADLGFQGVDSSPSFRRAERQAAEAAEEVRRVEQQIKLNEQVARRSSTRAAGIEGQISAETAAQQEADRLRRELEEERRNFNELKQTIDLNRSVREQTGALGTKTGGLEDATEKEKIRQREEEEKKREQEKENRGRARLLDRAIESGNLKLYDRALKDGAIKDHPTGPREDAPRQPKVVIPDVKKNFSELSDELLDYHQSVVEGLAQLRNVVAQTNQALADEATKRTDGYV